MEAKFSSFLTDTHAHLVSSRFTERIDEILLRAKEAGVRRIVSISCDVEDTEANIALATTHSGIFATAGIHPCSVHEPGEDGWRERLRELTKEPAVVAVGEIGLDHYHPPQDGSTESEWRQLQMSIFEEMLQLAQDMNLPAVVHSRECTSATLDVLANFPLVRAVLHCFNGTRPEAERALDMGHFFSFTGVLTYPKAPEVREVAAFIPLNRIMVETDSPYLAPVPFRGKTCEPAMVRHTAFQLAEVKRMGLDEIATITSENAEHFFPLSKMNLNSEHSLLA